MERYENYKDSGVEWIGEIPEGWEIKKLNYVVSEHSGNGFPNSEQGNEEFGIPFYKVSDINRNSMYVNKANNYVSMETANRNNWNIVPTRSVIAAKIGEALKKNHRKITTIDCIIDNNCIGLEPKSIDYKYNYYMLSIINFEWFVNPGAVPSLSVKKFKDFKVSIPPNLKEQTAIANYLDRKTAEIDQLIAQKERLLYLYEEEKTAMINQAVTQSIHNDCRDAKSCVSTKDSGIDWLGNFPEGWEVKKLKCFIAKAGSGITPRGGASVYQLTGIPLLRSQNIHFGALKLDDVAYITQETHDEMSKSKVYSGDVLLNITGASIGRCYYVTDGLGEANVNQHVCILRPTRNISTKFLYFILRSNLGQEQINLEQTGSGREGLNLETLKNLLIPSMKLEEQTAIVQHIETELTRINAKATKTKKIIILQKEYRTALISEVVTGKIKVTQEMAS